ncbi:hypothetical protein UB43_03420 [Pseudomonas sp. 21]|uniref:hypothetical protein n=1 Tax=Pseudomonas sp. 21 TaxID=1619948 RepID=UPI0005EB316A|nr:hypothetical protein [Pseudomonas sp. 21]KJK03562.1 hypothetical protein UB43_03420 [Pseudomonas sp. 21]
MALADERRAIGGGITSARKSQQLVSDLQSLESQRREIGKLNELERKGAKPAQTGRSSYTPPANTGTGGGIASPLTEVSYNARTYYDEYTVTSSDGLLTLKLKPIKQVKSVDANGAEVVQIYAEPTEGAGP